MGRAPPESSGFADVAGTRLHYRLAGEGPPVVLLHGFGGDLRTWDAQVGALSARHRVLRYDLRGHGRSPPPDAPYSHADDLAALLDHLAIDRAAVVGLSLGGGVAVNFALKHPRRVRALVPIDAALSGHRWSADWAAEWRAAREAAVAHGIEAGRRRWLAHPLFAPAREQPALAARLAAMLDGYSGWHWTHQDPERVAQPPDRERLSELAVPTLVIAGARDLPDFLTIADTLARGIRGARLEVIADCGHLANLEAPAQVNALLAQFLATLA